MRTPIDPTTTPVEGSITWAIQKVRRAGGARAGGYPGAQTIDTQLANGATRKRVGLISSERMPVREGAKVVTADGTLVNADTATTWRNAASRSEDAIYEELVGLAG